MVVSKNKVEFARVFEFAKLVNAGKALEFHEKYDYNYKAISLIKDSFMYYEFNELDQMIERKEITFEQMCNLIELILLDSDNIFLSVPENNYYY